MFFHLFGLDENVLQDGGAIELGHLRSSVLHRKGNYRRSLKDIDLIVLC